MNTARWNTSAAGDDVTVTVTEKAVKQEAVKAVTMATAPRQVFSREHLLTKIWEDPFFGDKRTIDAHIKKLRQKIEAVGPHVIQTVWGVGYKFDDSGI